MYFSSYDPMRARRIPVRVARNNGLNRNSHPADVRKQAAQPADEPSTRSGYANGNAEQVDRLIDTNPPDDQRSAPRKAAIEEDMTTNEISWKEKTARLQADLENFRKRQTRRADEAIAAERERLLSIFLPVADNLSRALAHHNQGDDTLRQGIELTQRQLAQLLEAEGVTRLKTIGQSFDPTWHEAIATIPANVEPGIIVEEVEAGYKVGDKLLRPAKVVVAA